MKHQLSFWQKLTGDTRRSPFDKIEESVRQDVVRNLHNVLNARKGRAAGCRDFGLDDVEDLGKSPVRIAESIKRLILRFEPRIQPDNLQVLPSDNAPIDFVDGYFRASFIVKGRLIIDDSKRLPIRIRTTVVSEAADFDAMIQEEASDSTLGAKELRPRRILVEGEGDS
ncbi:hypothetical protein Pan216_23770 [Planctomycetes bacterium Pan216]|uniref:IraD/Gp25-like domain-containing protein n=1 Tax=Kolteria novifilia TaxID=2527975 RepID=A0A518B3M1_9BACT|nr:hypothetical protein Pan216_23770 [Planctomycetes bacterium Pan216]